MSWKFMLLLASLLLTACASSVDPETGEATQARSPAGGLLSGELSPDEYFGAITKANERDREEQQFMLNREPTRAYNIKTGRIEYVPEGTVQKWNEEYQRWEFTPIN
jgi:hypothetical protein